MFRWLRKIAIGIMLGVVGLVGYYIYLNRHVFNPAVDFAEAAKNWYEYDEREMSSMSGRVVSVREGDICQVRDREGRLWFIQLSGIQSPDLMRPTNKIERKFAVDAKQCLSRLVLSNDVQVAVAHRDERGSALGILFVGKTNINASVVENGYAQVPREYLKGLPLRDQYALIQAERKAKEQNAGIWDKGASSNPPKIAQRTP